MHWGQTSGIILAHVQPVLGDPERQTVFDRIGVRDIARGQLMGPISGLFPAEALCRLAGRVNPAACLAAKSRAAFSTFPK